MKLKDNEDVIDFLKSVTNCRKNVYFCSPEGDRLDLKSDLCRYVFLANVRGGSLLHDGSIVCDDTADYQYLEVFLA